jgi:hypothetical protein
MRLSGQRQVSPALGLIREGKLVWRVPASAAFPPGFSSDNGWSWRLFADQQVLVGSIYGEPTTIDQAYIRDLARGAATAGFSASTGEVLWRDPGSSFQCPYGKTQYPVRCRARGISTYRLGAGSSFEGLHVTVEGFDILTGKTTWSVPMGGAEVLVGGGTEPAIAGPSQLVLQGPAGPVVLDYATGAATRPAADATFWCMTRVKYEYSRPSQTRDGTWSHSRPGGLLATICDSRGRTATELPSAPATFATGARIGSHIVVATQDGYVGYRSR